MEGLRNVRNRFALFTRKGELAAGLLAALCLVMLPGCPGMTDACANDPCDDGDNCTVDTCTADDTTSSGFVCANDPVDCTSNSVCNPADGECVDCLDDADCDNGDFCDGDETCGADNNCVAGTAPCDEAGGEACIEDMDTCGTSCVDDADCAGEDDGLFCTGDPVCDTATGACGLSGSPCAAGEVCDEDNDACVECLVDADCAAGETCDTNSFTCFTATACNSNGDCDDGLFCNGAEVCTNGVCQAGDDPCAAGQDCAEGDDAAVCTDPVGETTALTLSIDNLTGTTADDTFVADLLFNSGTGTQVPSLQNGDSVNGLAGNDKLRATYSNNTGGNVVIAPQLSGVEDVCLSDFGGANTTTISGTNATGVTSVGNRGSLAQVLVNNLNALTDLSVTNSSFGLTVTYIAPAGNGTSDMGTLTLSNATNVAGANNQTININTPANGFETLNIVSEGAANSVNDINHAANTLTTLNVSGDQDLTVRRANPLPGSLTTINLGSFTGNSDLTVGGASNVTYTGGGGDDVINFAGTYTTNDIIDGGAGTNTLGVNSAQAVAAVSSQTNVTNINAILIPDQLNGAIDVTQFGAIDLILDTTAAATALTANASTAILGNGTFATLNNDDTAHTLGLTVSGSDTDDVLDINLQNADLGNTLTLNGAETVNLNSGNGSDGTAADGAANTATSITLAPTFGTGTLNILGDVAVTVAGAITAGAIDASASGAAFTMTTTTASTVAAGGAIITGSPFADQLVGGNAADSISGGDGNDKIKGGQGADLVTGGNGTDEHFFDATNQFGDIINDFTGGTDKIGLATGIINFAGIAGTEAAPLALAATNFETGRTDETQIAAGDANKIVRLSTSRTTTQLTTGTGAAVACYVLAHNSTTGRAELYHDADWSDAANRTLVAAMGNITNLSGVSALTFTDFEEID